MLLEYQFLSIASTVEKYGGPFYRAAQIQNVFTYVVPDNIARCISLYFLNVYHISAYVKLNTRWGKH